MNPFILQQLAAEQVKDQLAARLERQRLGAELLALPGKPVTAEALAHVALMGISSSTANLDAADGHASQAARIADGYRLPAVTVMISIHRALRASADGDMATAEQLYRQAAAELDPLGPWQYGAGVSILGRLSLLIMQDRVAEMTSELESLSSMSAMFVEPYALALAAAGRAAEARKLAGRPRPIRRDVLWLFMTGVRGLLAIAIDDSNEPNPPTRISCPMPPARSEPTARP